MQQNVFHAALSTKHHPSFHAFNLSCLRSSHQCIIYCQFYMSQYDKSWTPMNHQPFQAVNMLRHVGGTRTRPLAAIVRVCRQSRIFSLKSMLHYRLYPFLLACTHLLDGVSMACSNSCARGAVQRLQTSSRLPSIQIHSRPMSHSRFAQVHAIICSIVANCCQVPRAAA